MRCHGVLPISQSSPNFQFFNSWHFMTPICSRVRMCQYAHLMIAEWSWEGVLWCWPWNLEAYRNYKSMNYRHVHSTLNCQRLPKTKSQIMPDAQTCMGRRVAHGGGVDGREVLAFHDQNLGSKGWLGQTFEMSIQIYPNLIRLNKSPSNPSTCLCVQTQKAPQTVTHFYCN